MVEVNRKKNAVLNLFTRYLSLILSMGMSVFMVPLYLKNIPIIDYSAWLVTGNILAWLSAVDPGLTIVLQQRIAYSLGQKDYKSIGNLIFSGLLISTVIFFLIIIIGLSITYLLPIILSEERSVILKVPFIIAVFGTSLMLISFVLFSMNQGLQSSFGIGMVGIFSSLVTLLLTIILILKGYKLYSISIGLLFGGLINISGQFYYLRTRLSQFDITISYNLKEVINVFRSLRQTFLGRASGILVNNFDLIIISKFVNPAILVYYTMSKKAIDISRGFIEQPILSILPGISHLVGTNEVHKIQDLLQKLFYFMVWILTYVFLGFVLFNRSFITLWLGPKYFIGDQINLYICIALFLSTISSIFQNFSYSFGNIKSTSIVTIVHSFIYVSLLYILTFKYNIIGAPVAIILSLCILPIWYYPYSLNKKFAGVKISYYPIIKEFFIITLCFIPLITLNVGLLNYQITWYLFLFSTIIYTILYLLFLFIFSLKFKSYCRNAFSKIKLPITLK